jgi:catechol 2,3-dioxygenase-like lactoylglutathione lyase family enzyme
MPLDHLGFTGIKDLQASRAFYEKALGPLGYKVQVSPITT